MQRARLRKATGKDIALRKLPSRPLPTASFGSGKEDSHTRPSSRRSGSTHPCLVASLRGRPHAVSRKASRYPRCEGGGSPNEEAVSDAVTPARRPDAREPVCRLG